MKGMSVLKYDPAGKAAQAWEAGCQHLGGVTGERHQAAAREPALHLAFAEALLRRLGVFQEEHRVVEVELDLVPVEALEIALARMPRCDRRKDEQVAVRHMFERLIVVHDDGEMMRLDGLRAFAAEHGCPLISIADLVAYLEAAGTLADGNTRAGRQGGEGEIR